MERSSQRRAIEAYARLALSSDSVETSRRRDVLYVLRSARLLCSTSSISNSIACRIMTEDDKVRENRIRRIAERRGFRLEKSRRRHPRAVGFGGFMLCEAYRNVCVLGTHQFGL